LIFEKMLWSFFAESIILLMKYFLTSDRPETRNLAMSDSKRLIFDFPSTREATSEAVASTLVQIAGLAHSKGYTEGLKPSQWTALRYFSAKDSVHTVSAFATHQGSTRGAASQMVEVLVSKGLLARSATPEDRRVVLLELTPKARKLLEQDPLLIFAREIETLSHEDQNRLEVILSRLLQRMRDAMHGGD
jgi:DNA-binding MarR family transcriptional regulator